MNIFLLKKSEDFTDNTLKPSQDTKKEINVKGNFESDRINFKNYLAC